MSFVLPKGLTLDTAEDIQPHIKDLASSDNCLSICLSGNTLGVEASKACAAAIAKHTKLQSINLDDIFTRRLKQEIPPALEAFAAALVDKKSLTSVDLSDNAFGPPGVKAFLPLVSQNHAIRTLNVNNVGLTLRGGSLVARILLGLPVPTEEEFEKDLTLQNIGAGDPSRYAKLTKIVAGRNRLEDIGAIAFGKALKHLKIFTSVCIPQNGITAKGFAALAEGLAENKNLTELNVYDNTPGPEGAKSLAAAIPKFENLKILNLGDCMINSGLDDIYTALESQPSLEYLNLEYAEIEEERCDGLVKLLKKLPNLTSLQVNGNAFTPEHVAAMKAVLADNGHPDALGDLDENEIDLEDEVAELEEGVEKLSVA